MATATPLLLLFALLTVAASGTPQKPVWPEKFDAPFGLTTTIDGSTIFVNRTAHFYYDFALKASVIDYPESCLNGLVAGDAPCRLTFNHVGTYMLAPRGGVDCCLLFPGVGTIPPDFLAEFEFNGTRPNVQDLYGRRVTTNFWRSAAGFLYWTDAATGKDVQFRDGPSPVYWNWGVLTARNQSAATFAVPAQCASTCPTPPSLDAATHAHAARAALGPLGLRAVPQLPRLQKP